MEPFEQFGQLLGRAAHAQGKLGGLQVIARARFADDGGEGVALVFGARAEQHREQGDADGEQEQQAGGNRRPGAGQHADEAVAQIIRRLVLPHPAPFAPFVSEAASGGPPASSRRPGRRAQTPL